MEEKITNSVEIPAELPDLMKCKTLEQLMEATGSEKVYVESGYADLIEVPVGIQKKQKCDCMKVLKFSTNRCKFYDCFPLNNTSTLILGWLSNDLIFWAAKISLLTTLTEKVVGNGRRWSRIDDDNFNITAKKIKVEPWIKAINANAAYLNRRYYLLQSRDELIEVVKSQRPYAYKFFSNLGSGIENITRQWPEGRAGLGWGYQPFTKAGAVSLLRGYDNWGLQVIATALIPNVEILAKAGYLCSISILQKYANICPRVECSASSLSLIKANQWRNGKEWLDMKEGDFLLEGKSPSEILGGDKSICKFFKDIYDINEVCQTIRKLSEARVSIDELSWMFNWCYSNKSHKIDTRLFFEIQNILGHTYHNKPIISFKKLVSYLDRLNLNEAIDNRQAFDLLSDYFDTCKKLDMPPKIDSDSLMREHNVANRLWLQVKDEKENELLEKACSENAKLNYKEKEFFVRSIKDHKDLLDEAKQQSNCVASYSDRIIEGRSQIYVLRKTEEPDKSLVTLEIDPQTMKVGQCYLACNTPVKDGAIWDFIKKWDSKKIHPSRETA